jgi:hypothetical protein
MREAAAILEKTAGVLNTTALFWPLPMNAWKGRKTLLPGCGSLR